MGGDPQAAKGDGDQENKDRVSPSGALPSRQWGLGVRVLPAYDVGLHPVPQRPGQCQSGQWPKSPPCCPPFPSPLLGEGELGVLVILGQMEAAIQGGDSARSETGSFLWEQGRSSWTHRNLRNLLPYGYVGVWASFLLMRTGMGGAEGQGLGNGYPPRCFHVPRRLGDRHTLPHIPERRLSTHDRQTYAPIQLPLGRRVL